MAIVEVQAKSTKKWYILVFKPILKKIFLGYFSPNSMQKYWVKMVPKQVFTGVGLKAPPS